MKPTHSLLEPPPLNSYEAARGRATRWRTFSFVLLIDIAVLIGVLVAQAKQLHRFEHILKRARIELPR